MPKTALAPPPIITDPGPEYADDARMFQGIPGIERAANGRLWAVWYSGGTDEGPDNYVVVVTSDDDGDTWSAPRLVIAPPDRIRAYDPCLWHDPLGRMWLFWAQSLDLWDGRSGVWAITTGDSGSDNPTWSAPRRLCDGIMMNKPTVLSSGEWLLAAGVWDLPAFETTARAQRHDLGALVGSNVICSYDSGGTFSLLGQAQVPERTFDEHMIVERRDGNLWMLVRTAYGIGESFSTDRGRTWTPGGPSHIPHVDARFFIRRLAGGRLLLIRHNPPDGQTRSHLTAYLSDDDGLTWDGGLILDERIGVSYPDGIQAPDGTLRIIYDYARQTDKMILMAAITEDDIAAGRCVSDTARLRVCVNQATGANPAVGAA